MTLPVSCKRLSGWPAAALAIAGLATGPAFGEQGERTNEAATAQGAIVSTNASRQESKRLKDDLFKRKFTEDLFRSFMRPGDSLGGMISPPPQSRSALTLEQARKLKELRDREKYWLFLSPDEYTRDQTSENELQNADPNSVLLNLGNSPVLERFLRSLDRNRVAGNNAGPENPFRSGDIGEKGGDKGGIDGSMLRNDAKMAGVDPIRAMNEATAPKEMRVQTPEFFPLIFSSSPIPLERTEVEKERINEFKKILDGPKPSVAYTDPFSTLPMVGDSSLAPAGSLDGINSLSGAGTLGKQSPDSLMGGSNVKPLGASSQPAVQPNDSQSLLFPTINPPRRNF